MTCTRSGFVGGTGVEGLRGGQLAAGNDEDVDAGGAGLLENPPYDPPADGDVRPAAVDGADQGLRLMLPEVPEEFFAGSPAGERRM